MAAAKQHVYSDEEMRDLCERCDVLVERLNRILAHFDDPAPKPALELVVDNTRKVT